MRKQDLRQNEAKVRVFYASHMGGKSQEGSYIYANDHNECSGNSAETLLRNPTTRRG